MRRVLRGAFAAEALGRSLRDLDDGRDRAFVTDLVYGTLRRLIYLDAALAANLRAPDRLPERVRAALRIGAYERLVRGTPAHAAVDRWVDVIAREHPRLRGLGNAVLRRVDHPEAPDRPTRLSLPGWLLERFDSALAAGATAAAEGMLEPEPLWVTSFHPEAASRLADEGCEVADGPLPSTLRLRPSRPLGQLEAFRAGWIQPQNPTSALVGTMLIPERGERVLDLASGGGVKAAQLAAAGAEVTAVELDRDRIAAAERNLGRLGLSVAHLRADLSDPSRLPDVAPAPKVLLDAPCSGTGTLRGHPEIKLRLSQEGVAELAELQRGMLASAARLTAPGGTLLYAVCALTPDEGVDTIAAFLADRPDFEPTTGEPPVASVAAGPGRYLLPIEGRDGFFVATLARR